MSAASMRLDPIRLRMAESEFKRAIELNPNSVEANHWYSNMLPTTWADGEKREIYARRAAQLDPRSAIVRVNLGGTLQSLGRFDEAVAEFAGPSRSSRRNRTL